MAVQHGLSTIAARFLKPFLAGGLDAYPGLGLESVDFQDPEARVDFAVASAVFSIGSARLGRDDLGVVGALRNEGTLRVLDYLCRAGRSPLAALETIARYQNLVHDACVFELERTSTHVIAHMASRPGIESPPIVADFFMASLMLGLRRLGVEPAGNWVQFRHAEPRDRARFDEVFRCPLRFRADSDAAGFPLDALLRPLPDADPALAAALETHANQMLARLPGTDAALDALRAWLGRRLAEGAPTLAAAARALGTSERTLRRRLQGQGTSFQRLLDEVRADVAERYLAETDLSVEEIAFLLGFSEARALRRAFRRWHGRSIPARSLAARSL